MRQKSETTKVASEQVVKDIRRATRKQYSAEEKIRVVLDGLRGDLGVATDDAGGVTACLENLLDSLDGLSDLALNESTYQSIQGKFERAGAALDVMAGTGRPPQFESVRTPTEGLTYGNRVCLMFEKATPGTTATPRAAPVHRGLHAR
jgi:hypothetical protein